MEIKANRRRRFRKLLRERKIMKICRFEYRNKQNWGVLKGNEIFPVEELSELNLKSYHRNETKCLPQNEVNFLPPVQPSKIVCVGRNYAAHAAELGNKIPSEPLLFLKAPTSIVVNNENIVLPSQSNQVEFEGELGVVIGRDCKSLSVDDNPLEYIFGYICLNDVTARDLQKKDIQFTRSKSFDTFCPVSHLIETELDVSDIRLTTKVNGEIRQDARTSQMVFPIDFLIRYISNQMTLKAGDVVATGTPAGVSRLIHGDVCEIEIEGIGVLQNLVQNL